jgi:hypothetical protein
MAGRLRGARCLSWQSIIGLLQLQSFLVSVQSYTACACIVQACGLVSVFKQQDVHSTVFFLQCISVWLLLLNSHCVPSIWGCSCCVVLGARAALPAYVLVLNQVDQWHVHCCTWSCSGFYCSACAGSLIELGAFGVCYRSSPILAAACVPGFIHLKTRCPKAPKLALHVCTVVVALLWGHPGYMKR